MSTFHVGSIFLICWALASCANSLTPTIPRASVGDLSDYVLEPLALRVADEKISEASAELKLAHTPKATMQTVASLLNEVPWIGRLLNFRNVSQMRAMSSSESSQFFLPRFFRNGLNHCVASISCTFPLRCSGFRLVNTQM